MNEMINWIAHYNTLVIQIVFSVVLLLILIYVYRLFFVASPPLSMGESATDLSEVNEKLNQLLQGQKVGTLGLGKEALAATSPTAAAGAPLAGDAPAEVERLKAENAQLRAHLNESEKKVFELTPTGEGGSPAMTGAADAAPVAELNKKIEELQSRLSEYDIIADDIAELSQLRAENADLKKRLQAGGTAAAPASSPEPKAEAPAPESALDIESIVEDLARQSTPTPTTDVIAAPESLKLPDLSGLDSSVPSAEVASDAATPSPPQVAMPVSQTVTEAEKELMDEFEKSTRKGS